MSIVGVVLQPGEAEGVSLRGQRIDFLVTGEQSECCSMFELSVAPGFDVGAHYHTRMEEFFYVLEGEMALRSGDRVVRGGRGTFVSVPRGVAHSYADPGAVAARLLLVTSPPGFEKYFEEMASLAAGGVRLDADVMASLRARYDTIQIAPPTSA